METFTGSPSHDYLVRDFVTVQDLGIKSLIYISKAKVSIEEHNRLILITVPTAWQGVAIALTNLQSFICIPSNLKNCVIEVVLAEN